MAKKSYFSWILLFVFFSPTIFGSKKNHVNSLVKERQEFLLNSISHNKNDYKNIVVFGDSLSDHGRLNKNTFGLMVKPDTYWKSRWSNGPNWVDYVANALNLKIFNYAVGGAETRPSRKFWQRFVSHDLNTQIRTYRKEKHSFDPSKTLYVLWIGHNNYLGAHNNDAQKTVQDIIKAVRILNELGAKKFVIGTITTLGISPKSISKGEERQKYLMDLTNKHNENLLSEVRLNYLDIKIFNAQNLSLKAHLNYKDFGFDEIERPCYTGDLSGTYTGRKFCPNSVTTKYWDNLHPNSLMHCHYAVQFLSDLDFLKIPKSEAHDFCISGLKLNISK